METDTEEEIKAKLKENSDKFLELEKIKMERATEIVQRLNLFAGQLTLTDIMETPISLLSQLERAKIKLQEEQNKQTQKMIAKGPMKEIKGS